MNLPVIAGLFAGFLPFIPCLAQAEHSDRSLGSAKRGLSSTRFPHQFDKGNFEFGSDLEQPFASLARLAERSLLRLRPWIGRGSNSRLSRGNYRVYLCDDVERIRELELVFKIPRIDPDQGREVQFRGGFYPSARMIAIPAKEGEDMRWDLVHEIGHAVSSEFLLGYLISINEGIAEYAAERMIEDEPGAEKLLRDRRDWLLGQCSLAVDAGLPSIDDFVPLGHWEFLDEKVRSRNYALAWSLIRFLNRSKEPEVAGRFGSFMQLMARRTHPWQAFQEVWDTDVLDPLWHEYVESIARWTAVYGDWTFKGSKVRARVTSRGSSWALWRQKPEAGQAFSLSFRMAEDLDPKMGIGFILGQKDWENFVVAELRPESLLAIITREAGAWGAAAESPLPGPRITPGGKVFRLDCDARGRIRLWLDEDLLAEKELGSRANAGWFGLFASKSQGDPAGEPLAVSFSDVRIRLK